MKEFKVSLAYHENDDYNELWEIVGEKTYFARHTYFGGTWYFVADPLGYCELDHPCPDDYVFIVCNSKGKELFKSSNGDETSVFPCLRELSQLEWNKVVDTLRVKQENVSGNFWALAVGGMTNSGLDKWLLTFKDPDLYGDKAKDYDENWCWWTEEISHRNIATFEYVGTKYYISKHHMRHTVCNVDWYEYYSGTTFMGAAFDEKWIGTMYSKREALDKIWSVLEEIYPKASVFGISAVDVHKYFGSGEEIYCERRMKLHTAADRLINGNLKRKHIEDVIESEKNKKTFYEDFQAIKKVYPECMEDFSRPY